MFELFELYFPLFVRFVICFGLVKSLRALLGGMGILILALTISFYQYYLVFIIQDQLIIKSNIYSNLAIESVTGIILGVFLNLIFEIIPSIGRLIDTLRGSQFSEQFAPELGNRDSQLEMYGGLLMPALFFNGPYFEKFIFVIIDNLGTEQVLSFSRQLLTLNSICDVIFIIFEISIIIVFPLILVALSFEVIISILQKLNPAFQLGTELSLIKSAFGVFFMILLIQKVHAINITFDYYLNWFLHN